MKQVQIVRQFINNSAATNGGALYVNGTFIRSTIGKAFFVPSESMVNGYCIIALHCKSYAIMI